MEHLVYISNEQSKINAGPITEEFIGEIVNCALTHLELDRPCEINILYVDNEEIRCINRENRNIDSETDVLSFPLNDWDSPLEINPENGALLLGDVVISLEKAGSQAEEYGHRFQREVGFLLVHSILHLLGYDHMEEEDRLAMRRQEEEILAKLALVREDSFE